MYFYVNFAFYAYISERAGIWVKHLFGDGVTKGSCHGFHGYNKDCFSSKAS